MIHDIANLRREIASLWAAIRQPVVVSRPWDEWWLKPTSITLESPGIWTYTIEIWLHPYASAAAETGRKGRNAFEIGNTSSVQSEYTISSGSCAITGIQPAPIGKFFRVRGRQVTSSKMYYLFEHHNDPIISGGGGGGGGGGSSLDFS